MSPGSSSPNSPPPFAEQVADKAQRKLRSRQQKRNIWLGFGFFGLIGWAVVIPMLLGLALGIEIDRRFPTPYSWTIMLLVIGTILGGINAWYWIEKEGHDRSG